MKGKTINYHFLALTIVSLFVIVSCEKSTEPGEVNITDGETILRNLPVDYKDLVFVTPLGNINPPAHTFPTDHIYFYLSDPDKGGSINNTSKAVYAPGTGYVHYIFGPGTSGDYKMGVRMTNELSYYLGHIIPDASIKPGQKITAGQKIGNGSPVSYGVDLGMTDKNVTKTGFVNKARYSDETLNAVSPYKHFLDSLKTKLYSKNYREGSDKEGKIDFDIPGKLVGNWFVDGLATGESSYGNSSWDKHLSFVYDMYKPSQPVISIGGTLGVVGYFTLENSAPRFESVSVSSGKISYRMLSWYKSVGPQNGLMLVQMLSDDKIKVEVFPGSTQATAEFTSNAKTYSR